VRGIMENKEWVFVDGIFVEKDIDEAKKRISESTIRNLEENKIQAFTTFLDKLSKF
jgi:hypothetical protein